MTLRFNDGMEFDTSGALRLEKRSDGWYVIGEGFLMAVDSPGEGLEIIDSLNNNRKA